MGAHIVNGEFQSDKYPSCPPGKVPLSVKDKSAQDLLWAYAQRRRPVDAEFSADLEQALLAAGYVPSFAGIAELRRQIEALKEGIAECEGDGGCRATKVVEKLNEESSHSYDQRDLAILAAQRRVEALEAALDPLATMGSNIAGTMYDDCDSFELFGYVRGSHEAESRKRWVQRVDRKDLLVALITKWPKASLTTGHAALVSAFRGKERWEWPAKRRNWTPLAPSLAKRGRRWEDMTSAEQAEVRAQSAEEGDGYREEDFAGMKWDTR